MVRKHVTVDECRALMDNPGQIRNMSVISHAGHGKSTLFNTLLSAANCIKTADKDGGDGGRGDGVLSKSHAISMHYTVPEVMAKKDLDERDFLINMIDCPGHVDFSADVTAALRVTDGALVVVDCAEGVCMQTETVLRLALNERIRPVVFLNKMDRLIMELKMDPEEAYKYLDKTIANVNSVIATYDHDPALGDGQLQVAPTSGTAVMGSGLQGWAFSLDVFARMYATKFSIKEDKMREILWGDHYFDAKNRKWIDNDTNQNGDKLQRAFCQFILDPIYQVFDAFLAENSDKVEKMLKALNITLTEEENAQDPQNRLQAAMMKFLPAADNLLEMIVLHLPSPKKAQDYRAEMLYTGPCEGDQYFESIKQCNPKGCLIMYISKMVPTANKGEGQFFAFGRIFSGTVRAGMKVRIMGNDHVHGKKRGLFEDKPIERVVLMMGGNDQEPVEDIPCGNVCGLTGIDRYIMKSATVCTDGEKPHPLKDMKYSMTPVVRVAVETKNAADLPQLVEGLKCLAKTDPQAICTITESGEHVIAGAGELHLNICLKYLQTGFMKDADLKISDPVVAFRETVTEVSSIQCLSKSPNKHNRLFCKGAPLTEELCVDIEYGDAGPDEDVETRASFLAREYSSGWDVASAKKIWAYGPDQKGPNVIVDMTAGNTYVDELRDSVVAAWQWATKEGVLCEEPMRGVRMNIEDVTLHADAIHRGGGQIIPTARRVSLACYLTASPRLMEPVYRCDITTVSSAVGNVCSMLSHHRGSVISEEDKCEGGFLLHALLPVTESLVFLKKLHDAHGTEAIPHVVFDHWQLYPGDPLEEGSTCETFVKSRRERNGLKPEIPDISEYINRDTM